MRRPDRIVHGDKARAAWGADLPAWILRMAEEADATSQAAVARRIGYSPGTVSQMIGRTYLGRPQGVEEAFNSAFGGIMIACPVQGDMTAQKCREWRDKARGAFFSTNPERSRMHRACRRCPRFAAQPATPEAEE